MQPHGTVVWVFFVLLLGLCLVVLASLILVIFESFLSCLVIELLEDDAFTMSIVLELWSLNHKGDKRY